MDDTHPRARAVLTELYRQASPAKKMAILCGLNRMVFHMTRQAIMSRHPDAGEDEIRWRMAAHFHGEELACCAYGSPPWEDAPHD